MDRISIETVKRRLFDIFSDKYEFNFDGYTNTYGKMYFVKYMGGLNKLLKTYSKAMDVKSAEV